MYVYLYIYQVFWKKRLKMLRQIDAKLRFYKNFQQKTWASHLALSQLKEGQIKRGQTDMDQARETVCTAIRSIRENSYGPLGGQQHRLGTKVSAEQKSNTGIQSNNVISTKG